MSNSVVGDCASICCPICNEDLSRFDVAARSAHTEQCLDPGMPHALVSDSGKGKDAVPASCLATLARLSDCPVCGKGWSVRVQSQAEHTAECAKRHGISRKDLVKLVNMFQESLDSSSVSSISTSRGSSGSLSNKNGPSPSSGKGSSKLFGQQSTSKAPAQPQAQKSKGKGQLSSKRPQKEQRPKASIETWLNKHAAANSAGADRDGASSCRSPVSTGARRRSKPRSRPTSASISFEISEDEDFQSTKLHVSMRQTTIAAQKLGKRQQEFLDELDDELNEAKALSLSLKRGPEPLRRGKPPAKRKRASSEAAALLERSDILSCTEAQSYIRQRAMALERMDETNQTCEGCTGDMMHYSSHPEEKQPTTEGVYLWNASATGTPASDYCPIFEMYKMRHSSHSSTDGCLDDMMDHMLWACAAAAQQSKQQLDSSVGAPDEAALHEGYVSLLKAARESFERQKSNMRCSEWAREIRNPGVAHHTNKSTGICSDTGSEGGDVVLVSSSPRTDIFEQQGNVLRKQSTEGNCNSNFGHPSNLSSPDSSSSSSLLPSDLSLPEATSHDITQHQIDRPFGRAGSGRRASNLYGQPQNRLMRELQTSNPRERGVQGQEKILSCPNYASMPLDRLKAFAAAYGLRTNTPKRLLVHQLTEIWEQTHKKQPSSSDTVEIEGRSRTGLQASVDLLHEQLRQYIRGNTGIYEQIVCYQVLDFDAVYAIIAKHVPCQMWMLRKFFDAEGIVYSSYHD